ncbi:cytochrome b5-like heme/steroid binding domain-containing protein [Absidia repens]|uniref:Cytochrome b5-like heme/steroid binding domain-containing protein n=1 Tax=Absidia repens TaxID=90262 RepID=A0A1X2IR63_9FUNG|nr:cytochrome b5-like heme/steroid binding domain-containing protein [Absidia repens]
MSQIYSTADVNAHKTRQDLWLVIHNKVYDITEFVVEHPGGEEVLLDEAGKDATESFEDIGHSEEARFILEKYLIGELDEASRVNNHKFDPIRAGELPEEKQSGSAFRVILPTLAVAGVLLYKFVLSKN